MPYIAIDIQLNLNILKMKILTMKTVTIDQQTFIISIAIAVCFLVFIYYRIRRERMRILRTEKTLETEKLQLERDKLRIGLEHAKLEDEKIKEKLKRMRLRSYWSALNPREFEVELAELYKFLGYDVILTQATADGGVDIILEKGGGKTYVSCKKYEDKIGVIPIRELYGVMASDKVYRGIMACITPGFTEKAIEFANKTNITLLGLWEIIQMSEKKLKHLYEDSYEKAISLSPDEIINQNSTENPSSNADASQEIQAESATIQSATPKEFTVNQLVVYRNKFENGEAIRTRGFLCYDHDVQRKEMIFNIYNSFNEGIPEGESIEVHYGKTEDDVIDFFTNIEFEDDDTCCLVEVVGNTRFYGEDDLNSGDLYIEAIKIEFPK